MIKRISKYIVILLFLLFLFMFFFGNNVYQYKLTNKKDLTNEQIEKFENDIKAGVEIDLNEYIVKNKDYTNNVTRVNTFISNIINKCFGKVFEYLLKNIDV